MSDDPKTRLVALLRRWVELEPERCRQRVDVIDVRLSNDPLPAISWECVYPHWRGANFWEQDVGSIQAAVQSAIEARGWEWTVARDNNPGSTGVEFYRAWINKRRMASGEPDDPDRFVRDSMDSPCIALLSVHIAALEAEQKGDPPRSDSRVDRPSGNLRETARALLSCFEDHCKTGTDMFWLYRGFARQMLEFIVWQDKKAKDDDPIDTALHGRPEPKPGCDQHGFAFASEVGCIQANLGEIFRRLDAMDRDRESLGACVEITRQRVERLEKGHPDWLLQVGEEVAKKTGTVEAS